MLVEGHRTSNDIIQPRNAINRATPSTAQHHQLRNAIEQRLHRAASRLRA
jgi:hypothetical protein